VIGLATGDAIEQLTVRKFSDRAELIQGAKVSGQ
jgi:hypothetical protein